MCRHACIVLRCSAACCIAMRGLLVYAQLAEASASTFSSASGAMICTTMQMCAVHTRGVHSRMQTLLHACVAWRGVAYVACVRAFVRACVRACVRCVRVRASACVRLHACVHACAHAFVRMRASVRLRVCVRR